MVHMYHSFWMFVVIIYCLTIIILAKALRLRRQFPKSFEWYFNCFNQSLVSPTLSAFISIKRWKYLLKFWHFLFVWCYVLYLKEKRFFRHLFVYFKDLIGAILFSADHTWLQIQYFLKKWTKFNKNRQMDGKPYFAECISTALFFNEEQHSVGYAGVVARKYHIFIAFNSVDQIWSIVLIGSTQSDQ